LSFVSFEILCLTQSEVHPVPRRFSTLPGSLSPAKPDPPGLAGGSFYFLSRFFPVFYSSSILFFHLFFLQCIPFRVRGNRKKLNEFNKRTDFNTLSAVNTAILNLYPLFLHFNRIVLAVSHANSAPLAK
jgi:hypothetical protein